jgi:hypothetical protein
MPRRGCVEHRTWPTWLVPGSRRPLRAKGGLPGADYDCTASSSVFSTTGQCWLTLVPADLVAATGDCEYVHARRWLARRGCQLGASSHAP